MGCIRKLNGNRSKKFQAIVTTGYIDGKQRYKTVGTYKTKEEAEYELYRYIKHIDPKNNIITIKQVYDEWSKIKFKNISVGSQKYYDLAYRKMKIFHNMSVSDIKLSDLQKYCETETSYNQHAFKILMVQLLNYSVACDYIQKNYAQYLTVEKLVTKRQRKIFSNECITTAIKNNTEFDKILLIMLYTGMRVGELINLKRKDYDKNTNAIYIRSGKTKSSIRVIPIHPHIKKHINYFYNKNSTYLITKNNSQLKYETLRDAFKRMYNHTMHETRHTFATKCKECNLDTFITKKLLGHAVKDITFGTYTHLSIDNLRAEIEKITYI